MATLLDGKKLSEQICLELKEEVTILKQKYNQNIALAVILVGESPASKIYVSRKEKMAKEIGLISYVIHLPQTISESELLLEIEKLNNQKDVYGILVQLPLPDHIDEHHVILHISPDKDVDGFHPLNIGKLFLGLNVIAKPCTPLGIIKLLDHYNISVAGKNTLVVGRSNIVGKPVSAMLLAKNATVTIAHSKTKNLDQVCKNADILVAAVGKPEFIQGSWIKPGATVIDVGINRTDDSKLVGDVEFEAAKSRAEFITPVPGGVGPMTIAMLLTNCVNLFKYNKQVSS